MLYYDELVAFRGVIDVTHVLYIRASNVLLAMVLCSRYPFVSIALSHLHPHWQGQGLNQVLLENFKG